jgi:hypothetical protein
VPSEELHVHSSSVFRFNSNRDQKKRLLILTQEELFVASEGHDYVIERIPLVNNDIFLVLVHMAHSFTTSILAA